MEAPSTACPICDTEFHRTGEPGRPRSYCSTKCYRVAAHRRSYGPHSGVSFPNCHECGRVFCRHTGTRQGEITVCPDAGCKRLAHNRRMRNCLHSRRARQKGAFVERVDPLKVFEADGYRCHLCGKRTDPTKFGRHPKAPTVDHVIPLSRGGNHEPLNCRTACYRCNTAKGNRGGGEQLLLIS